MLLETFKEKLRLFSDNPDDVVINSGILLVQFHDEIIEAKIQVKDGNVIIIENDVKISAEQWIAKRVARLDLLANRILNYIPEEVNYVSPSGCLLDDMKVDPTEICGQFDNIETKIVEYLERPCEGETSVLYLTSDAGEGKTTIINQIARDQADRYVKNQTDWLLLPVSLGGKPFMRLDDVIVGSLVNKLRFPYLYYESAIELGRLGYIVFALDGFEEMFIETPSGEAISALGSLLQKFNSSGKVLIAARKAYFEFKSFKTQSQLFDTFPNSDVSFSKSVINRWERKQFVEYGNKQKVNADHIYDQLIKAIGDPNHPLVSRAVLVKRLFSVIGNNDVEDIIKKINLTDEDYFKEFIDVIIEREVNEKWIDKSGDVAKPLLDKDGHYMLLSNIAEEMWTTAADSLPSPILDVLSELTCDNLKLPPLVTRQVVERAKQHSLIIRSYASREEFQFDHEEFKWYFLGQRIIELIVNKKKNELKRILRQGSLASLVCHSVSLALNKRNVQAKETLDYLQAVSESEGSGSFISENIATLCLMLLNGKVNKKIIEISNLFFNSDSLESIDLHNIIFDNCIFQNTSTSKSVIKNCEFRDCTINKIEIDDTAVFNDVILSNSLPTTIFLSSKDVQQFEPESISASLSSLGFKILKNNHVEVEFEDKEEDPKMVVLKRATRIFYRSTFVNEDIFKVKLGSDSNFFFTAILPELLKSSILEETQYKGGGKQKRYKVNVRMADFESAFARSKGNFTRFLEALVS